MADTYGLFHWLLLRPERYSAIEGSHVLVHSLTLSYSSFYMSVEPVEHSPYLVILYTEMVKPYCKQSLELITEECISQSERSGGLKELHVLAKVSASSTCISTPC